MPEKIKWSFFTECFLVFKVQCRSKWKNIFITEIMISYVFLHFSLIEEHNWDKFKQKIKGFVLIIMLMMRTRRIRSIYGLLRKTFCKTYKSNWSLPSYNKAYMSSRTSADAPPPPLQTAATPALPFLCLRTCRINGIGNLITSNWLFYWDFEARSNMLMRILSRWRWLFQSYIPPTKLQEFEHHYNLMDVPEIQHHHVHWPSPESRSKPC